MGFLPDRDGLADGGSGVVVRPEEDGGPQILVQPPAVDVGALAVHVVDGHNEGDPVVAEGRLKGVGALPYLGRVAEPTPVGLQCLQKLGLSQTVSALSMSLLHKKRQTS